MRWRGATARVCDACHRRWRGCQLVARMVREEYMRTPPPLCRQRTLLGAGISNENKLGDRVTGCNDTRYARSFLVAEEAARSHVAVSIHSLHRDA